MKILFKDTRIEPMTGDGETYSYMGIEKGKIIYLGQKEPLEKYDSVISLSGKYIYPTLCDSHLHLLYSIVLSATSFNICRILDDKIVPNTLQEVENTIRKYVKNHPGKGMIMINQYIPAGIKERRLPYKRELDEWTGGRKVVIFTMDGHSCSLSSALAEKLKIETDSGILTGAEYDMIQGKITSYAASNVSFSVLAKGIAAFTNECFRYGITKVCALDGDETGGGKDPLLTLLVFLTRRMDLQVRLYPEYMDYRILDRIGKYQKARRIGGCAKWELDGSVGSHSAAFYHPFRDTRTMGHLYYKDEVIQEKVHEALEKKMQLTCHAIGTAAIDQISESYRKNEALIPKSGPMPRIDHFEFPSEQAIDFIKRHRVAITVQPDYAYADKKCLHTYENFLDPEDLSKIVPLKDLFDAGAVILGSSDSPVQSVNPYQQMRGMMKYYLPDQSLTARQAFESYTVNAAKALAEEEGRLQTGGPATFFISSFDILHLSADEMPLAVAEEVYIDGKKMKKKRGTVPELIWMLLKKPHKI